MNQPPDQQPPTPGQPYARAPGTYPVSAPYAGQPASPVLPAPAQAPPPPPPPPTSFVETSGRHRYRHRRRDRGTRHGAITAGVWLIALGLVFLVRDWMGWSWNEAWPLFVVALGGASLVTSLLRRSELDAGSWSLVWPVAWIGIGIVLLAATTENLGVGLGDLLSRWWPVGLILIGAWFLVAAVWPGRRRAVEALTLPLGASPTAAVQLRFGGGVLDIVRAAPGTLLSGTFEGGVRYRMHGTDAVELEPDSGRGWPMGGATFRWSVGLTGEKPLDLRLDTGASRATVDLLDLQVQRLDVHSGAAETRIRMPRASGQTLVRTDTGVASLLIEIPPGVAARIRSSMSLGRVDVDERRFPRSASGWETSDYATAAHRVDMDVRGGVGSVTIR